MRRLHWFWRATIAMAAGTAVGAGLLFCLPIVSLANISLPGWAEYLLLVIVVACPQPIAIFVYIRLTNRRMRDGYCQKCDYNLTGNVSGICPECGKPCK